jgi:5-methylcytosine-specific restriction endonuclease McrA
VPRSERKKTFDAELEAARPLVLARAGHRCERCNGYKPLIVHHKQGRYVPDANTLPKLAGLCDDCHKHVHAHPTQSYEDGWMLKRTT